MDVPEGFSPHARKSPVTDPWAPIFARRRPGLVELGLRLGPAHCNSRGFIHGGVIAALADNAMGLSLGETLKVQGAIQVAIQDAAQGAGQGAGEGAGQGAGQGAGEGAGEGAGHGAGQGAEAGAGPAGASRGAVQRTGAPQGAVTVGLAVDYVGAGKLGQWLTITPRVVKAGRSLGFVDALVTADDTIIARANATFQIRT